MKKRIDASGDASPLSNNPFANLRTSHPTLPEGPKSATDAPQPEDSTPAVPGYRVAKTRKGGLPVFVERRAKGKTVTVIRQVSGDLQGLLSALKKRCGAGGVARDGEIEVQGDHRAAVEKFLRGE